MQRQVDQDVAPVRTNAFRQPSIALVRNILPPVGQAPEHLGHPVRCSHGGIGDELHLPTVVMSEQGDRAPVPRHGRGSPVTGIRP